MVQRGRNAEHLFRERMSPGPLPSVLLRQPGGIYDVTGPEAMSVADIAERLSTLVGRSLSYEDEPAAVMRERLRKSDPLAWRVELSVGWFEAIAGGELTGRATRSFGSLEWRRSPSKSISARSLTCCARCGSFKMRPLTRVHAGLH